jgi:predicted ABC-type ATPase
MDEDACNPAHDRHDVPAGDVHRRFVRSLKLLLSDYLPLATRWVVWDNRRLPPRELANSGSDNLEQLRAILAR